MPADIRFASFNLYNFQKAGLTTYGSEPVTPEAYAAKRDWIRAMLIRMDADVVALQELWHPDCLRDVLAVPELADYEPVFIGPEWYNIAVAMLVRRPWQVTEKENIKRFRFSKLVKLDEGDGRDDDVAVSIKQFSRTIIKATIEHASDTRTPPLTVFACHLKSKLPAQVSGIARAYSGAVGSALATIRRTAEATALRILLVDHMRGSGTPTVVMGDLNDDPLSNTLSLISELPSMTPRARGVDKALYSTLFLQQLKSFRDVFYTHQHEHHRSVLDHILVSEEFFEYSPDCIWKHQDTRIFNDHIDDDHPYSSDHGIICSAFR